MGEDPDIKDLRAWQDGDKEAGSRLVSRHLPMVYRFFDSKVGDDVADLVQSTFLECVRAKNAFRGQASFRTYLLSIARNIYLMHMRRRYRSEGRALDFSVASLADLGISPSQHLGNQQQARLVYEAMRRLPLDHQILLELFYWERLTGAELAQVFGVPENTIRSRLRKARALLRSALDSLILDPSALQATVHDLDDLVARLRDEAFARFPDLAAEPDEARGSDEKS